MLTLRAGNGSEHYWGRNEFFFNYYAIVNRAPQPIKGNAVIVESGPRVRHETYAASSNPLSVRSYLRGGAEYEVDGTPMRIAPGDVLIVNGSQSYSSSKKVSRCAQSIKVFFTKSLVAEVLDSLRSGHAALLSGPKGHETLDFTRLLRPDRSGVRSRLHALHRGLTDGEPDPLWIEEQMVLLLEEMIYLERGERKAVEHLSATTGAVREEIYRRLQHVCDFIAGNLGEPMDLPCLAQMAYMSRTHFLRCFRQMYGISPHQYIRKARLERARVLLTTTSKPVKEIALEIGLSSASVLVRSFNEEFGQTPQRFRRSATGMADG